MVPTVLRQTISEVAEHCGRVEDSWAESTFQHSPSLPCLQATRSTPQKHLAIQAGACGTLWALGIGCHQQGNTGHLNKFTSNSIFHYIHECWVLATEGPRGCRISPKWSKNMNWKVRLIKEHSPYVCKCVSGEHPCYISAGLLSDFNQNWKITKYSYCFSWFNLWSLIHWTISLGYHSYLWSDHVTISRSLFLPHSPFLAVSENASLQRFLPEIF